MSQGKTDNEQGYTPTTEEVRKDYAAARNYGDHEYENDASDFDRWLAATLAAHRVTLVADSRGALARKMFAASYAEGEEAGDATWDTCEQTYWFALADALLASGVVTIADAKQVTTPTETDELPNIEQSLMSLLEDAEQLCGLSDYPESHYGQWLNGKAAGIESAISVLRTALASRPAPVAPPTEEFTSAKAHRAAHGDLCKCAWKRPREQYEAEQKPVVPVDALGFPTQEGATFTAKRHGSEVRLALRAVNVDAEFIDPNGGRRRAFETIGGGPYLLTTNLDPASIEDVRPADGRNG